jgi:hypothetical protein
VAGVGGRPPPLCRSLSDQIPTTLLPWTAFTKTDPVVGRKGSCGQESLAAIARRIAALPGGDGVNAGESAHRNQRHHDARVGEVFVEIAEKKQLPGF